MNENIKVCLRRHRRTTGGLHSTAMARHYEQSIARRFATYRATYRETPFAHLDLRNRGGLWFRLFWLSGSQFRGVLLTFICAKLDDSWRFTVPVLTVALCFLLFPKTFEHPVSKVSLMGGPFWGRLVHILASVGRNEDCLKSQRNSRPRPLASSTRNFTCHFCVVVFSSVVRCQALVVGPATLKFSLLPFKVKLAGASRSCELRTRKRIWNLGQGG